jgi:Bacterial regulatory helix-turn-helix proteins, AraC family.
MKGETFEDYQARMLRVLAHIQKNLDGSIPLEELAGVAHFSPFHFHRIFRGLVGESVKT